MSKSLVQVVESAKASFLAIDPNAERVQWNKEAGYAMQILSNWKPDILRSVDPNSIRFAVVNVASAGLSLNPALGLAYLVPRDGRCCLDISYKGLVMLVTDSGAIRHVFAEVVRATDKFVWRGFDQLPIHEYNPFATREERGAVLGVWCAAKTSDGDWLVSKMTRQEIDEIRETSKAKNSPAWVKWFDEMAKKSILKRAQKLWPRSVRERMAPAMEILNEHEGLRDEELSQDEYYQLPRATDEAPPPEAEIIEGEFGEPNDEEEDLGDEKPLADGPRKVAQAKLKAARISEDDLFEAFNVKGWGELQQRQINDVLAWIEEKAS